MCLTRGLKGSARTFCFSNSIFKRNLTKIMSKKRTRLNLDTKLKLLKDLDSRILSQKAIATKYGVHSATVSKILKQRKQIEEALHSLVFTPECKQMRTSKTKYVDERLFCWFKQARIISVPISGPILMEKANEIAAEINVDFVATSGWLDRFKKSHGIVLRAICGESASVDSSQMDECLKSATCEDVKEQFNVDDVEVQHRDESEQAQLVSNVTAQEALVALQILKIYVEKKGPEEIIESVCSVEKVLKEILSMQKQTKITDFFPKYV